MIYEIRKMTSATSRGELISTATSHDDAAAKIRRWADANDWRVAALDIDTDEDGVDAFLTSTRNPSASLVVSANRI